MDVERVSGGERLRIAVLADFDSVHAQSWLTWFVARGHDMHAISYRTPGSALDGVTLHVLRPSRTDSADRGRDAHDTPISAGPPARRADDLLHRASDRLPAGALRVANGVRYRMAGLRPVVREIAPDVFHAHFVVEHGFYGALAGYHPFVVTAWGSDVLLAPDQDPLSKLIARWTMRRADLLTSNNQYMAARMVALGAQRSKVHLVTLGADRYWLEECERSVNLRPEGPARAPVIISTRAHEPLYNLDDIIDAFAVVARVRPDARLAIAHGGPQTAALRKQAASIAGHIDFLGYLDAAAFREALHGAEVFVSVPSSDGTSVALLQAMAAGCFPIVSDLPTQRELIEDRVNGFLVPPRRPDLLAKAIERALGDAGLRREAASRNRRIVEERGLNETQMARMEALYRGLTVTPATRRQSR